MNDYQKSLIRQAESAPNKRMFIRSSQPEIVEAVRDMVTDGCMTKQQSTPRGTFYSATAAGRVAAGLEYETVESIEQVEAAQNKVKADLLADRTRWNARYKHSAKKRQGN